MDSDADGEDELAEVDDSDSAEAGNGEIARTGEFQVTEAEREADKNLAVQLVVAFGIGLATVYGVVPGALATMAGPVMIVVLNALTRVGRRRVEHAAETLLDAADEAGLPVAEFFERAVADDRRHELFTRALSIAQDTALRDKRRALGRALAAGVMGDNARIDEELLFMRALEDIDEMHIRLLARMANTYPPEVGPGWSARMIGKADPGLANGAPALLGTLQLHGLVEEVVRNRPIQGEGANQAFYNITRQARDFLNRLAEDPDVSLPQGVPMTGQARHQWGVAGPQIVQAGGQLGPGGVLAGQLVGKDAEAARLGQGVLLAVQQLAGGADLGVADQRAGPYGWLRGLTVAGGVGGIGPEARSHPGL